MLAEPPLQSLQSGPARFGGERCRWIGTAPSPLSEAGGLRRDTGHAPPRLARSHSLAARGRLHAGQVAIEDLDAGGAQAKGRVLPRKLGVMLDLACVPAGVRRRPSAAGSGKPMRAHQLARPACASPSAGGAAPRRNQCVSGCLAPDAAPPLLRPQTVRPPGRRSARVCGPFRRRGWAAAGDDAVRGTWSVDSFPPGALRRAGPAAAAFPHSPGRK